MEYSQFLFSQLFMLVMKSQVIQMAYDEVHPTLEKVYQHWLATDALYGRFDHEAEYDAIENYLKTHKEHIACLLSE